MSKPSLTNFLLAVIAVALLAIAARPYIYPAPAQAQAGAPHPFYIEPGVQMLRRPDGAGQVFGRIVVDLRSGTIWGFPTTTMDAYPTNVSDPKPVTSHPFPLGRFAFDETDK